MKKSPILIFIALSTCAIALAQYSKYDVVDYFRLIPTDYLTDNFLDIRATQNATLEEDREDILEWGQKPIDSSATFGFNNIVDIKNGYISADHYYIYGLFNEFVVWKAKNRQDVIGISTRVDLKNYNGDSKMGPQTDTKISQSLTFYTYVKGRFIETNYFLPSGRKLLELARTKLPDLKKVTYPNLVYILPRTGTKVRIANYILPKTKFGKVIIRDFASLIWNGTELKFSERP